MDMLPADKEQHSVCVIAPGIEHRGRRLRGVRRALSGGVMTISHHESEGTQQHSDHRYQRRRLAGPYPGGESAGTARSAGQQRFTRVRRCQNRVRFSFCAEGDEIAVGSALGADWMPWMQTRTSNRPGNGRRLS
ncbi:hypothetical protein A4G28_23585 [Mycobacterium ostraviense]|uniref:Uncharacterized protein n=1 Tax=Mycobacterium ostraviense TaxID=2738409 RepID=A0A164DZ60_9MYCO|nr:hypothetical protein A4G28_23585 [Mycobacterium ostraviense]